MLLSSAACVHLLQHHPPFDHSLVWKLWCIILWISSHMAFLDQFNHSITLWVNIYGTHVRQYKSFSVPFTPLSGRQLYYLAGAKQLLHFIRLMPMQVYLTSSLLPSVICWSAPRRPRHWRATGDAEEVTLGLPLPPALSADTGVRSRP